MAIKEKSFTAENEDKEINKLTIMFVDFYEKRQLKYWEVSEDQS